MAVLLIAGSNIAVASFPGQNGKFVDGDGTWVTTRNPDGTGWQQIAPGGAAAKWSADGAKIVFYTPAGQDEEIFSVNDDGTGLAQLTNTAPTYLNRQPTWSPDGTKVAFVEIVNGSYDDRLATMNADGSNVTVLFDPPGAGGYIGNPAWSPDGSKIAFEYATHDFTYADIYTIPAGGGTPTKVSTDPPGMDRTNGTANWSPDGSKIAYYGADAGGAGVFVVNADGTGQTGLTYSTDASDSKPIWAPDGTKILFNRNTRFGTFLFSMNPDGSNQALFVTCCLPDDWQPVSPVGANLSLTKSDSIDPVYQGERFSYTIRVEHVGGTAQTAQDTVVADTLPAGLTILSAATTQGACSIADPTVTCQLGDLVYPNTAMVTIGVEATGSANVTNTATVQSSTTDPVAYNNTESETTAVQPVAGYARPKGATPLSVSLVPAYVKCNSPNVTHGPPLDSASCKPPGPLSPYLTVGTNDANGAAANSAGAAKLSVIAGNPATEADEADVLLTLSMSDVRNAGTLTDYTGQLKGITTVRITDKSNGNPSVFPATVTDYAFSLEVSCAATASAAVGSTCSTSTTADALIPGVIREGRRSIWALEKMRVLDGGEDGLASSDDNVLFATQGLFVP